MYICYIRDSYYMLMPSENSARRNLHFFSSVNCIKNNEKYYDYNHHETNNI